MFSSIASMLLEVSSDRHHHRPLFGFNEGVSSEGIITMLNDDFVRDLSDDFSLDEISSPLSCQLFGFCDPELFQTTEAALTNSEVASNSNNCCYADNSSYPVNTTYNNINNVKTANYTDTITTTINKPPTANHNDDLSIIFHSQEQMENDISASIDFSTSPPFCNVPAVPYVDNSTIAANQFNFSSFQPAQPPTLTDLIVGNDPLATFVGTIDTNGLLPSFYEDDRLSSYLRINNPSPPSCPLLDHDMPSLFFPGNMNMNMNTNMFSAENSVFYIENNNGMHLSSELDYQGDNGGMYCPDSIQRLLNSSDLQALNNESQQLMNGGGSCGTNTPLRTEISSLEESSFKVGKLSPEQRKEKIHRYMKKRNERNFNKKIKYACRKTLADSRPRVRGRFAKNEESAENNRLANNLPEEDDDEDLQLMTVKEEDELGDSSDIFSHISGVNSFRCNYSIQSWI